MAFILANVRKRRLRDKQPTPAYYALPAPAFAALADEAWSELMSLSNDARWKDVHYVHVRTNHPDHRQRSSFTREQFWRHISSTYRQG